MAKEKAINLCERISIKGIQGAKTLQVGKVYKVHPDTAKRLVKNKEAEIILDKKEKE